MRAPIRSIEEFYSHAVAIEREACERYKEFAAYFGDRGEEVLAGLCANLAALEGDHLRRLLQAIGNVALQDVSADRYRWIDARSPEAGAREAFYRIATPRHLLEVALDAEHRAHDFFRWARDTSDDARVRAAAAEMAEEEAEHIRWVRHALEYHPAGGVAWAHVVA